MYRLVMYLLLLLGSGLELVAQEVISPVYTYPSFTFSTSSGLSQQQSTRLLQDDNGFLWIGTKQGINRFDGHKFENFKNIKNWPSDQIQDVSQDEDGNVWILGISRIWKSEGDHFREVLNFSDRFENFPIHLAVLNEGFFVFIVQGSPSKIYASIDCELHEIPNYDGYPIFAGMRKVGNRIALLSKRQDEQTRVLWMLDQNLYREILNIFEAPLAERTFVKKDGGIALSIRDSLFQFQESGKHEFLKTLPARPEGGTIHMADDRIFSTHSSAAYQLSDDQLHWIDMNLPIDFCRESLLDRDGNLWRSSEKGLRKIFTKGFKNYEQKNGLNNSVWTLIEQKPGSILFASYINGLQSLEENQYRSWPEPRHRFYMGGTKDENGNALLPTERVGVLKIDSLGRQSYLPKLSTQPKLFVFDDQLMKQLIIGTNGMETLDDEGNYRFYGSEDGLDIKRFKYIVSIARDSEGILWLGSQRGLASYNGETFKNYYPGNEVVAGVVSMHLDSRENLWMGTKEGLLNYDGNTESLTRIIPELGPTTVSSISAIGDSVLVLGTSENLVLLDLDAYYDGFTQLTFYDNRSGFSGQECGQNGSLNDSNGVQWISTSTMITTLDAEELEIAAQATKPYFKSISYTNKNGEQIHQQLDSRNRIVLSSSDRNIEISYSLVDHKFNHQYTFSHQLEEVEDRWSNPDESRKILFPFLAPGERRLKLKACLNAKCAIAEELQIKVKPSKFLEFRFGKFLALYALAMLLFSLVRFRRKNLQEKKAAEQIKLKLLQSEIDELTLLQGTIQNQLKPHFTFNALSSLAGLVSADRKQEATDFITTFAALFEEVLTDSSKLTHSLKKELDFTSNYLELEKIRFGSRFNFTIEVDPNLDMSLQIPKMVVQSFVGNSITHGLERLSRGEIKVAMKKEEENSVIEVSDNGIGRVAAKKLGQKGTGQGVDLVERIFEHYNKRSEFNYDFEIIDMRDKEDKASGTMVRIQIEPKNPNT